MAESSIPVDPLNPVQVFACLGFMEAADQLLGEAEAGFDWSEAAARFSVVAYDIGHPKRWRRVFKMMHRHPRESTVRGRIDLAMNGDVRRAYM